MSKEDMKIINFHIDRTINYIIYILNSFFIIPQTKTLEIYLWNFTQPRLLMH